MDEPSDLSLLFHRLNNQLGVILANAELLEAKLPDAAARARAGQVVAGALEALTTAKQLRTHVRAQSSGQEPSVCQHDDGKGP